MSFRVREIVDIYGNDGRYILTGQIVNYNKYREPGKEYAIFVEGYDDYFFVGQKNIRKVES